MLDTSIQHAAAEDSGTDPRVIAGISRQKADLQQQEQLCGQLAPEDLRQTRQRVLQAAERGAPWATLRYLLAPALRNRHGLVDLDAAVEYRQRALALLERTALEGHELALRTLLNIYEQGEFHNEDIALELKPDPARALAIAQRLQAARNPYDAADMRQRAQALSARLTPAERAQAQAFHARLAQTPLTDAVTDRDYQMPNVADCQR